MTKNIIDYIEYLIKYASPKKEIFIAIDGVVPMAKINQQRKRRYKMVDELGTLIKIKEECDIIHNDTWNNLTLTPGTEFMEKIHEEIKKYISKKKI